MIPPWDQLRYFQTPTETIYTLAGSATQLCVADPTRVAIIFANSSGNNCNIGFTSAITSGKGIQLPANQQPLIMTHDWWGPLVQHEWWGVSGVPANISVYQVSLSGWPGRSDSDEPRPTQTHGRSAVSRLLAIVAAIARAK